MSMFSIKIQHFIWEKSCVYDLKHLSLKSNKLMVIFNVISYCIL